MPAVVFFGKAAGQSFAPSFVTQLWKFLADEGAQTRPAPQVPLEGDDWQMRPSDTLLVGAAVAAQDAGATWVTFAKAPAGTASDAESALHAPTSEPMLAVDPPTAHVASLVTASVKLPLEHEPPTPEHVHEQVGVPSPLTCRSSVVVVPVGQLDCDEVEKSTGVHPSATAVQLQLPPPSPAVPSVPPSPVAASGSSKLRSGSELHPATVNATNAISGERRPSTVRA
jgi:hypothetical protein